MEKRWWKLLSRIIDDEKRILSKESELLTYSYDASFGTHRPERVVQPITAEEISRIVKMAVRERVPLYPRGEATSLSGGPLPVRGGLVLDLTRMNHTLDVDRENLLAVVSPGVLTSEVHQAAEKEGLMYPPDPSSMQIATIGGNLAENAGGPRGLKYGVTKDYVLGLEVVTPEGEIIRTGGYTVKNVTGYDLTRLLIGSEGTLGIVTEAVLRLIPKPKAAESLMAVFDDIVDGGAAVTEVLSSGVLPSKIELMDQASIQAVEDYEPCQLPKEAAAILLIEVDGHPAAVRDEIRQIGRHCQAGGAKTLRYAHTPSEQAELWKARKRVSPAIAKIKPTKISEDATVPRAQIPTLFQRLNEIKRKYDLHLVVFGHAGDGNLHPNIMADIRDEEEMKRAEQAVREIFETAVDLGGTLSGEHGIGTMKASFMEMELGETGMDMMKRIKKAWDPYDIMNPGKMFPEPGQKLILRE